MESNHKVLIVNNNMQMGGIQKSLLNLICAEKDNYDITLLLFSRYGELFSEIPKGIKVIYAAKPFEILGTPWSALKSNPWLAAYKLLAMTVNKLFGKQTAFRMLSIFQKKITGYTHAISFSHCTNQKVLSVCTPEFVLNCVEAEKKICYLHCDYSNSDTASEHNNQIYGQFDTIACCSRSVCDKFLDVVPVLAKKAVVARNYMDLSVIEKSAEMPHQYDSQYINLVSVARISEEKGIFRAVQAIHQASCDNVRYYIIGDGPDREMVQRYIDENHLSNQIFLLGVQLNPYRYMHNADYLLVPSYHEAAPMVFDEANMLGLRVISTDTTSAREMLTDPGDMICDILDATLFQTLAKGTGVKKPHLDNNEAHEMFVSVLGE